jgi:proton-translocating NADH-quinone oxidoreductase chain L
MPDQQTLLLLVPVFPLLGAILCCLFGGIKGAKHLAHVPAVVGAALACLCAFTLVFSLPEQGIHFPGDGPGDHPLVWFSVDTAAVKFAAEFGLKLDQLSGIMLTVITFIGTWIVVFSIGYMHGSPGYPRYFAVVSLFLASMLLLVLADNYLLMFAGWEGVGVCSYLLVGYWYHKPSAAAAARKAFLVTRLGDVGLILGIMLLWQMAGKMSLRYDWIFPMLQQGGSEQQNILAVALLLLLCGAVGKSAQFPLYVWLPDAMEGPTPVSALIHAATMVTAGIYLLARSAVLFSMVPSVQIIVAVIGALTAILAAFIALTQTDLKRVLAYSTVSQLGFMFLALGCSGPIAPSIAVGAAMFHLFTHAFFKGVLFLSAGSVMHAMHDTMDMRQFSGLRKVLPVTHLAFLGGAAALAGLPLLSGFWSKDLVLDAAYEAGHGKHYAALYFLLFLVAVLTAFMTAFYTFRAYFKTFWGEVKMPEGSHPHETTVMNVPLIVLGVCAVFIGIVVEPFTHWFSHFLNHAPVIKMADVGQHAEHHTNWMLVLLSVVISIGGVGLAYAMYVVKPSRADTVARLSAGAYSWSLNKLYVDEIYNLLFVKPFNLLASFTKFLEATVYELMQLIASIPRFLGDSIRPIQNGLVQFYALSMAMGVAALVAAAVWFAN